MFGPQTAVTTAPQPRSPAPETSTAARALAAAGDAESARDVGALDDAAQKASARLGRRRKGLVERLVYGPAPATEELQSGAFAAQRAGARGEPVVAAALQSLQRGEAFTADGKLSAALRAAVAAEKAYGFTVPAEFGGLDGRYVELALVEEELAANGLGPLAVEISGELTIGAGSLLAYGTDAQKRTFLPLVVQGEMMAFGLTEVGIGVNAKKVRAYVEPDAATGGFRLFAMGDRNKLWITNATHGGLVGIVARLGEHGKQVGLFVTRLPAKDVAKADGCDHEFSCVSSNTGAFTANHNARLHFFNYPLAKHEQIQADGVEVLFYCLRMGRCMLAAMAAGYQRMFAVDAAAYATARDGVGGAVIKHELPRQHIGRMLGGALQSRALSHLSLQQDADGTDLAGLRDLTKSAAATSALESQIACERVIGGRSFDRSSRVHEARANMHVFGVVEGEDDLILMGMVKDVTDAFTGRYMAGLLSVIQSLNEGADGEPLPADRRILRITPGTALREPRRVLVASWRLLAKGSFWRLGLWVLGNLLLELLLLPLHLLPAASIPRYQLLPTGLRRYARFAERRLRWLRWAWLGINAHFQLELTRAQIPLQRLGKVIEQLVTMLALCHHAAKQDASQQRVAALQCEQLATRVRGTRLLTGLWQMDRLRRLVGAVGDDVEKGQCSLLAGVAPQPVAHAWEPRDRKPRNR
ncbi:MAG TPA: acyl-CoA dehydrogenase family protein [Planctomycetota bacterium]|nr:acyl-CoA dehydrogenase family protein [Planctomycetota bacterium]